jgi:hypothetical protein
MMRRLTLCLAASAVVIGFVSAGSASADTDESPNHPGGPPGSCSFWNSAPMLIDVSGTPMVTGTTQMKSCTGVISVNRIDSCVAGGALSKCSFLFVANGVAQAYLAPYFPGTTYTVTGSACMTSPQLSAPHCVNVAPVSKTL